MRARDLIVGESYRHKDHPNYCWAKVVEILQPRQKENPHNRVVVKCNYGQSKVSQFGLVKYFRPSDLVKPGNEESK